VPDEPAVTLRPMFGNLAAFVNGNMFAGLFGEDLFVRLPDEQSAPIRKQGGRDFEPMAGRAMKGYVTVPSTWRSQTAASKQWIAASLTFARGLPPKAPAGKKAAAKKPSARK
jgi:TfoX/Sxy family transcriptional regulator of competence genes